MSFLLLVVSLLAVVDMMQCVQRARGYTFTTFNMLAPVHRSMMMDNDDDHRRESEREEWWRPRAEEVTRFLVEELHRSDVVLLQEWWFAKEFENLFDERIRGTFERVASERRTGKNRQDGLAVLLRTNGPFTYKGSQRIVTNPELQKIAQLVQCTDPHGRLIQIANCHMSFPHNTHNPLIDQFRQAKEVNSVLRALETQRKEDEAVLEVVGGDFNSNSVGWPALLLERKGYVSCASALSEQVCFGNTGGRTHLGVTHRTHRGEDVSVDHLFTRLVPPPPPPTAASSSSSSSCSCPSSLRLGYLDTRGTRVVDCVNRMDLLLQGRSVISDHRPVTAIIAWPTTSDDHIERRNNHQNSWRQEPVLTHQEEQYLVHHPLDPLEPPSYLGKSFNVSSSSNANSI